MQGHNGNEICCTQLVTRLIETMQTQTLTLSPETSPLGALRHAMEAAAGGPVKERDAIIVREHLREQGFRIQRHPCSHWHIKAARKICRMT